MYGGEAAHRPFAPRPWLWEQPPSYAEDDGHLERWWATARAAGRAPRRAGRVVRQLGVAGLVEAAAPSLRVRALPATTEVTDDGEAFAWAVRTLAAR